MDGQAELAWVAGYVLRQFTCPKAVTSVAQCRAIALRFSLAVMRWSRPTHYR